MNARQPAENDARTWAQRHGLATGHHTVESLTDPGSCLDCSERSPAYQMTRPDAEKDARAVVAELRRLADDPDEMGREVYRLTGVREDLIPEVAAGVCTALRAVIDSRPLPPADGGTDD